MATATQSRSLAVKYNGTTVPGSVGAGTSTLVNVHTFRVERDSFEVTVDVLIVSSSLAADAATFEAAWGSELGDLEVKLSGTNMLALRRSAGEALNTLATVEKIGEADSQGSRVYRVTFEGERPGVRTGGRREAEFSVAMNASNRGQLDVSGIYTRTAGAGALANYRAGVAARVASFITALQAVSSDFDGTWSLAEESFDDDDNDDVCDFSRTYKQLLSDEVSGAADDPDVRDSSLEVIETTEQGEAGIDTVIEPLKIITASYEAFIDATTKKGTAEMRSKWDGALKSRVLAVMALAIGGGSITESSVEVSYDEVENSLSATVTAFASVGLRIVSYSQEIATSISGGIIVTKTWPKGRSTLSPMKPTGAYTFQGPKEITRTIATTRTLRGDQRAAKKPFDFAIPKILGKTSAGGQTSTRWIFVSASPSERAYKKNGEAFTDVTMTEVYELVGGV